MHYIVVEPHADDAYLSMHHHMTSWLKQGHKVTIQTVFSGTRKRALDARNYADAIGASWFGYGAVEGGSINPLESLDFDCSGPLGILDANTTIIGPLGIQHSEHKDVRAWLEKQIDINLQYYAEIPYYSKQKNEDEFNELVNNKSVVSVRKPKHYKADDKYWKCFKDQAKFFFYNTPASFKDQVEIIVR